MPRFDGRTFEKDELLFRENLMDHVTRLVPAHAGAHQKALATHVSPPGKTLKRLKYRAEPDGFLIWARLLAA
jgi:hypothetical protein